MYSVTVGHRRLGTLEITFFSMAPMLGLVVGSGPISCGAGVVLVLIKYFSGSNEGLNFLYASPIVGVYRPVAMVVQRLAGVVKKRKATALRLVNLGFHSFTGKNKKLR